MKEKPSSEDKKPKKGKGTILTLSVTEADAERLKKAFEDGLLDKYGVTELNFAPEPEAAEKKWASKRPRRRGAAPDQDTSSEPLR
jgi:hypothetical protein